MKSHICLALALSAPLAACTDAATEGDVLSDDVNQLAGAAPAGVPAAAAGAYYQVEPGEQSGVYYSLVNSYSTKCIDGTEADRCFAAELDWARLGLGETAVAQAQAALGTHQLIVRGTIGRKSAGIRGSFAELRPTEAWLGQGPNDPSGVFAKVEDAKVRCLTLPCSSFRETKLNVKGTAMLAELGWEMSEARQDQLDTASADLVINGLIVAGDRYTVTGRGGSASARTVTNFYQRAIDKIDLTGEWRYFVADGSRIAYSFNADGSFGAMHQPACMFAVPACAVKMAALGGSYSIDHDVLHLNYITTVRKGERADFRIIGKAATMRLAGKDFDQQVDLRRAAP